MMTAVTRPDPAASGPVDVLLDDGPSPALAGTELADAFRYWRGRSARRYLHRVLPFGDLPAVLSDLRALDAHVIAVRRTAGRCAAVWQGLSDDPRIDMALRAAVLAGATELHLHGLDDRRRLTDLLHDLQPAASRPGEISAFAGRVRPDRISHRPAIAPLHLSPVAA